MKANELREWIVPGMLLAGAVFVADKLFGNSPSEEGLDELNGGVPSGQKPTLPLQSLVVYADVLEQALLGGFFEDEDAVFGVFAQMGNEADVWALVKQFDVRCVWGVPVVSCGTLPQAITYYLDGSEVDRINEILAGNGINFSFGSNG